MLICKKFAKCAIKYYFKINLNFFIYKFYSDKKICIIVYVNSKASDCRLIYIESVH